MTGAQSISEGSAHSPLGVARDARGTQGGEGARRLSRRALAAIFAVAVLAHAWILALPFQFDDYALVGDPLSIFVSARHDPTDWSQFEMRFTMWALWSLCHAVAGNPLSPLPFHLAGLLLHGAVAVLLARLVARVAPTQLAARAGLAAGLGFGISSGGIQAVSWIAAQSDLLFPLFGLLAAHAFLAARERSGASAWMARVLAVLYACTALVSKSPAFLVPPALFVLLAATPRARGGRARGLGLELALLALATGLGFVARNLYLASYGVRFLGGMLLGLDGFLPLLGRALGVLGQALYPWNRHPLLEGDGPLLAELFFAHGAVNPRSVGLALFAAVVLAGAAARRCARGPLAVAVALAVACSAPAALLYSGQPLNILSRTTYFPLLAAWSALGIAWASLATRSRALLAFVAALLLLVVLDTTFHVARTELLAADEQRATRAEIERLAREHAELGTGRELVVLAVLSGQDFGSALNFGHLLGAALRPPFTPEPGFDVRAVLVADAALELLASESFAERDLALVVDGPVAGASTATESPARRASARLRRVGDIRPGVSATSLATSGAWRRDAGDAARWVAEPPLPAHALCVVAVEFAAGTDERGELVLEREDGSSSAIPLELAASAAARRVPLETWLSLADALGPRIVAAHWTGAATLAGPPSALEHAPRLEPVAPAAEAEIELGAAPRFRLAAPAGWALPRAARVEIREVPLLERPPFFGDARVSTSERTFDVVLESAHLARNHAPASAALDVYPWSAARAVLEATLRNRVGYRGQMEWRTSLLHPGGHTAARSVFRPGRFVLAGTRAD